MAVIIGDQNDNVLTGTPDDDVISGLGGNDTLTGGDGDDILEGGDGNDTIDGGNGSDTASYENASAAVTIDLFGQNPFFSQDTVGAGNDILVDIENVIGSAHDDTITGGFDDNIIAGLDGADTLDGSFGNDTLDYSASDAGVTINLFAQTASGGHAEGDMISRFENVIGSAYDDILISGDIAGALLDGRAGDDIFVNGAGTQTILGGTGDDIIIAIANAFLDNVDGGAGDDALDHSRVNAASVNGAQYDFAAGTLTTTFATGGNNGPVILDLLNIETFYDGAGSNIITGTNLAQTFFGNNGDDDIFGNGGDDALHGGNGNDLLDGGAGFDTASYEGAASTGVTVSLAITGQQNTVGYGLDTLVDIEGLIGSEYNDTLTGNASANTLEGSGGHDILEGGAGGDLLDGGAGIDTASYEGSTNRVLINMATNSITSGHATGDTYVSIENVTGSNFGDAITGSGGDNVLDGGAGADILSGFNGDDTIFGGAGRDFITGGAGADNIVGGAGIDIARYVGSNAGVDVDLGAGTASGGHAQGDVLNGIEQLFGSSHDDSLTGDGLNNFIFGSGGDDTLDGGAGIDKLFGGTGADIFVFGAGDTYAYVTDWEDDIDSLNLSEYGFGTVQDALANMNQFGDHVRFFVNGETLLILNADLADMADDIIIDAPII